MARRKGWRTVKKHWSYTADEAARNQCVSKGTVLRWLNTGLPCLKDQRPYLILGRDLVTYLKARAKPKQTLQPDEFLCLKCRAPRKAAFGEAEFKPKIKGAGKVTALCGVCATVMGKNVSKGTLAALNGLLRLSFPLGHERISDASYPRSNADFGKE